MVIIKDNQYYIPITSNGYGTFRRNNVKVGRFYSTVTGKPIANEQVLGNGADGRTDETGMFVFGECEEGTREKLWYTVHDWNLGWGTFEPTLDTSTQFCDIYVRDYYKLEINIASSNQDVILTVSNGDEYSLDYEDEFIYLPVGVTWTATLTHKSVWEHYGTLSKSSGTANADDSISTTAPYNTTWDNYNNSCGCGNE